jgi:hypothetical protein
MVVIESSQKIEVNFKVVKNVSVDAHQPNQVDEIPKSTPYWKSLFKASVCVEVYLKVHYNKNDCCYDQ